MKYPDVHRRVIFAKPYIPNSRGTGNRMVNLQILFLQGIR